VQRPKTVRKVRIKDNYKLKTMKKTILLFLGIVAINCISFGQRIDIGIKGGVSFSKLEIPDVNTSNKTGYHLGAYSLFKFGKLGLQPEIIFSQQGSKVELGDWDTKYINIPIILKFYLGAGFNLQAGPQFGFLNKAELDGNSIEDDLKNADVSLGMGLGWDTPIGLNFDARYNLGLTDNSDDPAYATIKSQVFQLSLGFRIFHLGKK
jgi:Outer membrane protein beta-barrel domain